MLDRVLGRAALKERIAALEDEKSDLEAQLEAESERRAEAARKRQTAEERVNRLEDRIAELEDRVDRAETDAEAVGFRDERTLRGDRLAEVLARLDSLETGPEGALSAMVTDEVPDPLRERFGDRAPLLDRAAPALVYADDADLLSVAVRPPLPPDPFVEWGEGFRVDRDWFEPRGRYAIALVRADRFAIGEYDGRDRLSASGFDSDVQGDHSKGGWSQGRFERRRDAQIAEHLAAVREAIADRDAERLYVVGESTLLGEFADEAAVTRPSDATGKPVPALEEAVADFWTARLFLL